MSAQDTLPTRGPLAALFVYLWRVLEELSA